MFHRYFILFKHSLSVIPNYTLLGHLHFDWAPPMMPGVKFFSLMLRDFDGLPVQGPY